LQRVWRRGKRFAWF